ncbi:MAG: hypothetical protein ACHQRJ_05265 [Alphaproteobacteria bacterium]
MTPRGAASGIHCPIGLYEKHEGELARLTEAINRSPTAHEKAQAAHDLRQSVSVLLDCDAYDEGNLNCRMCREVAILRNKTAAVVEKIGALHR